MIPTTRWTLLEKMRGGGDRRTWHEFFHMYASMLVAFAKRIGLSDADANDAVQETLIAVHEVYSNKNEMKGPVDGSGGRFRSWLGAIAKHKVRDIQRQRARIERVEAERRAENANETADESELDEAYRIEWLRNLLARAQARVAREVDPATFQAFEQYVIHDKPPAEVAPLLGITRNAVYISKSRVLRKLGPILEGLIREEG